LKAERQFAYEIIKAGRADLIEWWMICVFSSGSISLLIERASTGLFCAMQSLPKRFNDRLRAFAA